ncbi:MAG: CBS domain-containing protein [Thermodesulfobacteriota bacterium]
MLVKKWMSRKVIAVDPDDSMLNAVNLLREHDIRMLPVIKDGKLVGGVTDRDIKRSSALHATTLEIHELMYLISKALFLKWMPSLKNRETAWTGSGKKTTCVAPAEITAPTHGSPT